MIKNIRKYKNSDRKFFQELPVTFCNSDFYLENHAFVGIFNKEKVLFEKIKKKNGLEKIYLKNILKNTSLNGLSFKDLSESQLNFLKTNKYDILKEGISMINFHYDTKKFLERGLKSKKYLNFIKKNKFRILNKADNKKVLCCFLEWKKEMEKKGRISKKTIKDILYILNNDNKYYAKKIFLEINDKIVGFAIALKYDVNHKSNFFCLYNYFIHKPRDIHYFLKIERVKFFDTKYFLDFSFSIESNITKYKKENFKEKYFNKVYFVDLK